MRPRGQRRGWSFFPEMLPLPSSGAGQLDPREDEPPDIQRGKET